MFTYLGSVVDQQLQILRQDQVKQGRTDKTEEFLELKFPQTEDEDENFQE